MAKKNFVRSLPSVHAEERAVAEGQMQNRLEEARREQARKLAAFDWLLKQENGRIVWAWIFDRCGYSKAMLLRRSSDGDVASLSTEAAAAQREVYRDMRKMISAPELLAQAEFEAEFGVKPSETKGEK